MSSGLVPYAMWHHQHHFKEVEGGVQMDDILHYKLKGGKLGALLTGWMVHGRVKNIFDHRSKCLLKSLEARIWGDPEVTIDTTHWRPTLPSRGQASPLN